MVDQGEMDEKVLAVSADDPSYKGIMHIDQLPKHTVKEITHFFEVYKALEGKETKVTGFKDEKEALRIIGECQEKYKKKYK